MSFFSPSTNALRTPAASLTLPASSESSTAVACSSESPTCNAALARTRTPGSHLSQRDGEAQVVMSAANDWLHLSPHDGEPPVALSNTRGCSTVRSPGSIFELLPPGFLARLAAPVSSEDLSEKGAESSGDDENQREFSEVRTGFEPAYNGFANRCLTTWLPHRSNGKRTGVFHHPGPFVNVSG